MPAELTEEATCTASVTLKRVCVGCYILVMFVLMCRLARGGRHRSSKAEHEEWRARAQVPPSSKVCKACFRLYLRVFHPIWVLGPGGGGPPKALVHNLLMQFFTLCCSKIEVFETCFFDIVTTQNDHPSYVKHVLGRIYVFFTRFGY